MKGRWLTNFQNSMIDVVLFSIIFYLLGMSIFCFNVDLIQMHFAKFITCKGENNYYTIRNTKKKPSWLSSI